MSQSTTTRRSPILTDGQSMPVRPRGADIPVESHAFEVAFLPDPIRVAEMRQTTKGFLRRSGISGTVVDDVALVVSELVTNAICHGDGAVVLSVLAAGGELRVSVTDQSPDRAELGHPTAEDMSGRGLLLVDSFAHIWGSSGEETWCTFRYPLGDDGAVAA
ncbi:ATP-binding protein [Streptomyces sp. NPDC058257]|uniref:ATP-binding protein n=1 Tax=unclassified Streptomyces TaxID=2593676 RepID=UPI00364CFE97